MEYETRAAAAPSWLARSLSVQHPSIVANVNKRRRRMGLPLIQTSGDPNAKLIRTAGGGYRSVPASEIAATTRTIKPQATPRATSRARKPAGAATWPRRPKSRAEIDLLRLRADAFLAKWKRPCDLLREKKLEAMWRR
jgi:hypothetical protein